MGIFLGAAMSKLKQDGTQKENANNSFRMFVSSNKKVKRGSIRQSPTTEANHVPGHQAADLLQLFVFHTICFLNATHLAFPKTLSEISILSIRLFFSTIVC
jgi:hypothetical protein